VSSSGNKLSNLQRLENLSSDLDFTVPDTQVLTGEHFDCSVCNVTGISPKQILVETMSSEESNRIRQSLLLRPLPENTINTLRAIHDDFQTNYGSPTLCVRSCFGLEDLASSSFAGAFDTVHSVLGFDMLCRAVQVVYASVFSDRALHEIRNAHLTELPSMSVAVQIMIGGAGWSGGVAHTQCPELSPFPLMLFSVGSNASDVTSGNAIPEEYLVSRTNLGQPNLRVVMQSQPGSSTQDSFTLSDSLLRRTAKTLVALEQAFETPLEVEWLVDPSGGLHLLQARPAFFNQTPIRATGTFADADPLCIGMPVGNGRVTGPLRRVHSLEEALHVPPGFVIATENTDPDWVPVVRRAAGLISAVGARTSHVSRTARESDVLAVVGCGTDLDALTNGDVVTIVCAEGVHGAVYAGDLPSQALTMSTTDAHVSSVSAALTLARSSQPEHVYFDLTCLLRAYRLPSTSAPFRDLPHRLQRRIAGHSDIASFAFQKFVQAICLVSCAFPSASLHLRLDPKASAGIDLRNVVDVCRKEYGVFADLRWFD
jgi:pyruvate,water dikinase